MGKTTIPRAVREQVWLIHMGCTYQNTCPVKWCQNTITVFDFHVAHDVPESKGGSHNLSNLKPICSRCNLSMGKQYTIKEWEDSFRVGKRRKYYSRWDYFIACCFTGYIPTHNEEELELFTSYQQNPIGDRE